MTVFEWLEATNANERGITYQERIRRIDLRRRVVEAAKTTMPTLLVARRRGSIGRSLIERMEEATKGEKLRITLADELAADQKQAPDAQA